MIKRVKREPKLRPNAADHKVLAAAKLALEQVLLIALTEGRGDLFLDRDGTWTVKADGRRVWAEGPEGQRLPLDVVGVDVRLRVPSK